MYSLINCAGNPPLPAAAPPPGDGSEAAGVAVELALNNQPYPRHGPILRRSNSEYTLETVRLYSCSAIKTRQDRVWAACADDKGIH
jgi:hypothetical protein